MEGEIDAEMAQEDGDEDEEMEDDDDDDDKENNVQDDTDTEIIEEPPSKANHLPDHLFASAFASQPRNEKSSKTSTKPSKGSHKKARRQRSGNISPRDHIVGSRVVRTLPKPDAGPRASIAMLPSAKVKKFLDRSLSMKGDKSRVRGWERRAANIGSMRRQGPAAHFVRGS
ncbi:hypothetical protein F5050DRAFT_1753912 [Lentinula boryana]|uniref:Uncharacterized protein n=1 Tax=Lentinula boryana TaxID=40481 RepID=A0ABQ8QFA6_9AGAR|nr:hypothetical protein F5050DRAFT_1753912 [Lentinula boryana]